jgi:hypothetical protein
MTENVCIPNSFQTPNVVVDRLMGLLTPSETIVLIFTVRHVLGWRDKIEDQSGYISLTMYEQGFTSSNGQMFGGCGLSRTAVVAALRILVQYGVLRKIGEAKNKGQHWAQVAARRVALPFEVELFAAPVIAPADPHRRADPAV